MPDHHLGGAAAGDAVGGEGQADHGERRWSGTQLASLAGAGLLAATGGIHLDLYLTGYGAVPTIGALFLLQAVAAFVLAALVLLGSRFAVHGAASPAVHGAAWPAVLAGAALFPLATLGGYLLSLSNGLFGFHEVRTAAGVAAGIVEVAAFAALAPGALSCLPRRFARPGLGAVPVVVVVGAALALGLEVAAATPGASGAAGAAARRSTVVAIEVAGYGEVLATTGHESLYLLSSEQGGRLECNGGCLSLWPPLLVRPGTATLSGGPGVLGRLGRVRRGHFDQVTYNGYPLYTYAGDPGPAASAGQGIVSFGGTWFLLRASARIPAATSVTRRS